MPPHHFSSHWKVNDRQARGFMYPPPYQEMLLARLGMGRKQPRLFQLNIIKVIKCLEIHANFMPTWLQLRYICCERLLRTVGELWGNMTASIRLSWSLKGFFWGGLVSSFGGPAFCEMKALQKQSAPNKVLWLLESLYACEWHLQVNGWDILVLGIIWKCRCIAVRGEDGGVSCSAAGFYVPMSKVCTVILRNDLLCRLSFEVSGLSCLGR